MKKQFISLLIAAVLLQLCAPIAFAQLTLCTITGTAYSPTGGVAAGVRIQIFEARRSGVLLQVSTKFAFSSATGAVSFNVPRNSQVRMYAPIVGMNDDPINGTWFTIPNSSSATLESLVSVSSVPSDGLTLQDEGTPLSGLYGTVNFVGSGVTVTQASPGVATVTVSGGGGSITVREVDGTPAVNPTTVAEFNQAAGFVVTDQTGGVARVDLNAVPYAKLNLTGSVINADIGSGAAIAYSKLNLATSIVNADVSASAAIALSKLASGSSIVTAVTNDTNIQGSISSNNLTFAWAGTLAKGRQNAATVYNDAGNTYSTGAQDFGSATSVKIPTSAGLAPTGNGIVGYDSTANKYKFGVNGATGVVLMESRAINTGTGLTGGGDLSADRSLSVVADTTNQRVKIQNNGTDVGTRPTVNFIPGSNVTLTVTDNSGSNRVDVTVASSGGASGYATVQDEGSGLTQRSTINFIGAGVTAADNSGAGKTDVTVLDASASQAGVVTTGTQTFAGAKTFNGNVVAGASFTSSGAINQTQTGVVTGSSYTVLSTDALVPFDSSSNAITATLQDLTTTDAGRIIVFFDRAGSALTNNITIQRGGSDTFDDGGTSIVLDVNFAAVRLLWTGSSSTCCWKRL